MLLLEILKWSFRGAGWRPWFQLEYAEYTKIYAKYAKSGNIKTNTQNTHSPLCWWSWHWPQPRAGGLGSRDILRSLMTAVAFYVCGTMKLRLVRFQISLRVDQRTMQCMHPRMDWQWNMICVETWKMGQAPRPGGGKRNSLQEKKRLEAMSDSARMAGRGPAPVPVRCTYVPVCVSQNTIYY